MRGKEEEGVEEIEIHGEEWKKNDNREATWNEEVKYEGEIKRSGR